MRVESITVTVTSTDEAGPAAQGVLVGIDGFHKRTVRFRYSASEGLQFWGRGDDKAEPYIGEIEKALDYTNFFGMRT